MNQKLRIKNLQKGPKQRINFRGNHRNMSTRNQVFCCSFHCSLRKTVGKVSPILVTLTSRSDSNFESSNVNLKEAKPDGVIPNSNGIDYYVRKNEEFYGFRQTD